MEMIREVIISSLIFILSLFPFENKQPIINPTLDLPSPTPVIQTTQPNTVQQSFREVFHFPEINQKKIDAIPYLTLPFRKADVPGTYEISEGWIYSATELAIHKGYPIHYGIDYALPYGTTIVAPVDGYAVSSYQTFRLKDSWNNIKIYQGKPLNVGFGYFVSIYNPTVNRFIDIAHLSDVDPAIPFSPPYKTSEGWQPTNHNYEPERFMKNPYVVYVKKGQVIGKVGYSGLTWGYDEYQAGARRPIPIDFKTMLSWDEPHIHFTEFFRDPKTGELNYFRDPYDIYDVSSAYPTAGKIKKLGPNPLFFLNKSGLPKYADE